MSGPRIQSPVKSDPYTKGLRRRVPAFRLWPDVCWKEIVDAVYAGKDPIGIIVKWNRALYGKS